MKKQLCLVVMFLTFAGIACTLPGSATPTPLIISATPPLEEASPEPSATSSSEITPTDNPLPEPSITPTLETEPDPAIVQFNPGATSVRITGTIPHLGMHTYRLYALKGQTMTVTVQATGGQVALTIWGETDGTPLVRSDFGLTTWSDVLRLSQYYSIAVVSREGQSDYTLDISIPPLETVNTTPQDCWFTLNQPTTAYRESSFQAEVFGEGQTGDRYLALAQTSDGWLGFDPGIAQAGNQGRARLRWFHFEKSGGAVTYDDLEICRKLPRVLSIASLENGTYPLDGLPVTTLTNGKYSDESFPRHTTLLRAVFGDLNADGLEDAIVLLVTDTGGTGRFEELFAMLNQDGMPWATAQTFIGDRVIVNEITIDADGTIVLDIITHRDNDGMCCPTKPMIIKFKLQNGVLVLVEEIEK